MATKPKGLKTSDNLAELFISIIAELFISIIGGARDMRSFGDPGVTLSCIANNAAGTRIACDGVAWGNFWSDTAPTS